jgi:two-component system response regulator NreC
MPVRILIADDHDVVRQGIRMILGARPAWEICGEAVNGIQAVEMAVKMRPDAIIMDVAMPEMTGIEATREITTRDSALKILIFTMHDSKSLPGYVQKAGARGYVLKSRAANDLVTALELILAGGTFFDSHEGKKTKAEPQNPPVMLRVALCFA